VLRFPPFFLAYSGKKGRSYTNPLKGGPMAKKVEAKAAAKAPAAKKATKKPAKAAAKTKK
jgi:hypothetical protein